MAKAQSFDKLFHVLVVLGGTAAGCDEVDSSRRDPPVDAATATPDADDSAAPCFCNVTGPGACCDRTTASPHVLAGFTCCWSTVCD